MKFIQAHQMAKNTIRYCTTPVSDVVLDERVVKAGRGLGDRHHETQVEQQLQRRGHPVLLVGVRGPASGRYQGLLAVVSLIGSKGSIRDR